MKADDISPSDLGDGYTLNFQAARDVVRAVVKDAAGAIVATGIQVPRAEATRSRFDATAKFLDLKRAAEEAEEAAMDGFDEDESEDDEELL